jgi:hypothetical protein
MTNGTRHARLLTACLFAGLTCPPLQFASRNIREHTIVIARPSYDYQPTIIKEPVPARTKDRKKGQDGTGETRYRMWWCGGGVEGDYVMYAEAAALNGPWSAARAVFKPTGRKTDFDGVHTCDPSIVRADGAYYMFYGGWNNVAWDKPGGRITEIGVAKSTDGFTWTRLNGGRAIITATRGIGHPDFASLPNKYGAGQPSVTVLNGLFYLIYTDTTGLGGHPANGSGVYVLRSADPTFQANVEELIAPGRFAPRTAENHTTYPLIQTFGVDWQFVDLTRSFAIAISSADPAGHPVTNVVMFDESLATRQGSIDIAGAWREGPGIVSRPDKHAVTSSACVLVPFDIIRAYGEEGVTTWDLAHVGADWDTGLPCGCATRASDLRRGGRTQEDRRDVRHDLRIRIPGR